MQNKLFLFAWDAYGLEVCLDLTEIEQDNLISTLSDKPTKNINSILSMILLRANANHQRHYEIFTCQVDKDITVDDCKEMFANNPQHAADTIRNLGTNLYNNRRVKDEKIVIV